jgi:hypothetical protein
MRARYDGPANNPKAYYDWRVKMIKLYYDVKLRSEIDRLAHELPALQRALDVRARQSHAYPCRWATCPNRVMRSWGYHDWPAVEYCFECRREGRP